MIFLQKDDNNEKTNLVSIRNFQNSLVNYLLLSAVLPDRLSLECWIKVRSLCKAMLNDLWTIEDISPDLVWLCNQLANLQAFQGQPALSLEGLLRQIVSAPLLLDEEVTMLAFYLIGHDIAYWKTHLRQVFDVAGKSLHNGALNISHLLETPISRALPFKCQDNGSCTCLREDSILTVLLSHLFVAKPFSYQSKHSDSIVPTYTLARRIAKQIHSHIFIYCSPLSIGLLHHLDLKMQETGHLKMGHEPRHGNQTLFTVILLRVYLPQLLKQKPDYLLATKYLIHCTNNSTTLANLRESLLTQKLYQYLVEVGLLFTHPISRREILKSNSIKP